MKILMLSWRDVGHKQHGGAEVFTHEMLKRIAHKHDITHISRASDGATTHTETIDTIRYIRYNSALSQYIQRYFRFGDPLSIIYFAYQHCKNNTYDIVIDQCNTHHFMSSLWLSEDTNSAFFIHQLTREVWFLELPQPLSSIGYLLENVFLRLHKHTKTLTVSASTQQDLIDIGFQKSNITILPEGIDIPHIPLERLQNKLQYYINKDIQETHTLLYVGRISKNKGVEELINTIKILHCKGYQVHLDMIGSGKNEYIEYLTQRIKKDNLPITLHGRVPLETRNKAMEEAYILLLASTREGWGLVITEAHSQGTMAIGYNRHGIRDAIKHKKTGLLTDYNTCYSMAYSIEMMLINKQLWAYFTQNAYEDSKNYHWNYTAKAFEQWLQTHISS